MRDKTEGRNDRKRKSRSFTIVVWSREGRSCGSSEERVLVLRMQGFLKKIATFWDCREGHQRFKG